MKTPEEMTALLDAASAALRAGDFDRAFALDAEYRAAYRKEAKQGGWMYTHPWDPDLNVRW